MKTCICETKIYFGTTEDELKAQYNYHKKSLTHCIDEKPTFKYTCNLKDKDKSFTIKWSIAEKLVLTHVGLNDAICD